MGAAKAMIELGNLTEAKTGLPPIAPCDARLFILGSLPGDASLASRRYYAHPRNQFWRLLGSVVGKDLQAASYEQRINELAECRIGLWDVIASASRLGSLDQHIRSPLHNPVDRLLENFRNLEAIAFNGTTSFTIGRKLISDHHRVRLIPLPSSSPANTQPLAEKLAAWSQLAAFCGPGPCVGRRTRRDGEGDSNEHK